MTMVRFGLIAVVALGMPLAACTTASRVGLAVQIAQGVYCTAVTPEGKQALRDAVTGGRQLIACPEGTETAKAHPASPQDPPQ